MTPRQRAVLEAALARHQRCALGTSEQIRRGFRCVACGDWFRRPDAMRGHFRKAVRAAAQLAGELAAGGDVDGTRGGSRG